LSAGNGKEQPVWSSLSLMKAIQLMGPILGALLVGAAIAQTAPAKKLVEYGWDVPFPDYVKEHVREMEERPFDGVIFKLRELNQAFDTRRWDAARLEPQVETLRGIEWKRFTDNFLMLNSTDVWGMDWFDDGQWEAIAGNLRLVSRAAKAGRCAGVAFDPEPYGPNPWAFPGPYPDRSFEQVAAEVRKRGAQFIAALEAELPGLRLLTLFQLGIFGRLVDEPDPAARQAKLAGDIYALLPAFVAGMLDAAAPGTRIVDGNEPSYYYGTRDEFRRGYRLMKEGAAALVPPEARGAYASRVQAGMAVYMDYVLARWRPESDYPSRYASPRDRMLWLEHNVYRSLATTDEYVWFYSEGMSWWKGEIPAGVEEAVRSARAKLAAGQPLGFEIENFVARARQARDGAVAMRLLTRSSRARRLEPSESPPRLDGSLDDPAWSMHSPLAPFLVRAKALKDLPDARTTVWAAYDAKALYLAFRCEEPNPARLKAALEGTDRPGYEGDGVELFLSVGEAPAPRRTFTLNPGNVRGERPWAGAMPLSAVSAPPWRSAVGVGEGAWTAEVAIPWDAIGGLPAPGSARRVNLCRDRALAREVSCWSGFLENPESEPDRMGEWRF